MAALALAAAGVACATTRPLSLADRFVVPGTPAMDLTAPPATATPSAALPTVAPPAAATPPAPRPAPPPLVAARTLEASSPQLQARLAALAASPTPEAHLEVATTYAAYGVHDRAFDYLTAGLVRHPRHPGLHEAVARLWRDWGLPERAVRHAHLAVRYAPESPAALTTLGSVLWVLTFREEATRAFERAFALDGAAAYTRRNWCTAVQALGRPQPFACDTPERPGAGRLETPR